MIVHARRNILLVAWLWCATACASGAHDRGQTESLRTENADGWLFGTLQLPIDPAAPFPAVLIVPGSGAIDRDGNEGTALHTNCYRQLAAALAARGIASLRYDKAGVGQSAAATPISEASLLFDSGVYDASRWIAKLRDDPRIGQITLVGHSEGALVATLALKRQPADRLVVLEGAGRPIGQILRDQLGAALSDPAQRDAAFQIIAQLEQGQRVSRVPSELNAVFRPTVQPYLISWMAIDPALELSQVSVPGLIVHGSSDLQVPKGDAQLLKTAAPSFALHEIVGMNHVLKEDDSTALEEQAEHSYSDPKWQLSEELVELLATFASQ